MRSPIDNGVLIRQKCGDYKSYCFGCGRINICKNQCPEVKAFEKLADYEDAEEQGLLLKPKCKPGDIVWEINRDRNLISKFEVGSIRYGINHTFRYIWGNCISGIYSNLEGFWDKNIGKTVFLTEEAAKQALTE